MDISTLEGHAVVVRRMVDDLDRPGGRNDQAIRELTRQTEALAKRLLALGAAPPELKQEIIGWVLRFREESTRLETAAEPVRRKTARMPRQGKPAKQPEARTKPGKAVRQSRAAQLQNPVTAPYTVVFDCDTRDARTKNPNFVKQPRAAASPIETQPKKKKQKGQGKPRLSKAVPEELGSMFTGRVVSGGLPTLGRVR